LCELHAGSGLDPLNNPIEMETKPAPEPLTPSVSARRRLVRGAFGVPAVLALHTGSAFAGSNLRCVANQVASSTPLLPGPLGDALYVRAPLFYCNAGTSPTSSKRWFLSGKWLSDFAARVDGVANASGIGIGEWREVDIRVAGGTTEAKVAASNVAPPSTPVESASYFLVLRFRRGSLGNTAEIAGVFDSNAALEGTAIAGTCWLSVAALRPPV
jgi:hypothetical protein